MSIDYALSVYKYPSVQRCSQIRDDFEFDLGDDKESD